MDQTTDEDVLRRYLLGRLAPDARERIEARLFTDDRVFWERVSVEEDQLIDDYVSGRLDDEARQDFEGHFNCTEERRAKLEFVRALRAHCLQAPVEQAETRGWLHVPVAVPRWALAVAATLVLAVPATLWQVAGGRLSTQSPRVRLSADLVRAGGTIGRVQVPAGCSLLHLQLDPGDSKHALYRATLFDVSGEELQSQGRLAPTVVDGRPAVTMTVPCETLPEGDYYVRLYGTAERSEPAPLRRYELRVLRE